MNTLSRLIRGASRASGAHPAGEANAGAPGRVLLVEPHGAVTSGVRGCLERHGYAVSHAADVAMAMRRLGREGADVTIVDGALGAAAVLRLCAGLAGRASIIALIGKDASGLGIAALETGADDYLATPHNPRELVARVRALIRFRRRRARRAERRIGAALVLHQTGRVSSPDGRSVLITPTQHRLLEIFCGRPGEVIPRAQLRDLLYGEESECWERAIDVLVSRLRKRLASFGAADLISCYRGVGYRLEV